jgi:hypothetical protein
MVKYWWDWYKNLYQFSNINLKKKLNKKKFNKYPYRYVSKNVYDTYIGILIANPLVGYFKLMLDFDIGEIESIDKPNIELIFVDYKYDGL